MSDDKSSGGLGDRSEERSTQIAARRERDKELSAAIRTGDPRAARRAVNAWGDHVYDWARTHGLGTQDAEQVVVATFTAASKVLRAGSTSDLAVVVFRAARAQLAGSTARRASRRSASGPTAEDRLCRAVDLQVIAAEPEVASIMWDTADVLGERVRDLADLVYRHGLTPEEAGEVLGVPPDKAAELGKKLPTGFANTARTRVLWRGGEPEDAELAQALTDAKADGYGADAVRVINAHVKSSARSRARALMALPPIEVFGAIPVASLPDGDVRDAAATALLGEDEEDTGAATAATGAATAATGAGVATAKTGADTTTPTTGDDEAKPAAGTKAAVAGAAAAAGLAGAGLAAAKAGPDGGEAPDEAKDAADAATAPAPAEAAAGGAAEEPTGGDGEAGTDGGKVVTAAEPATADGDGDGNGDEERKSGTGTKVAAGAAGAAGAALLGASAAKADEGADAADTATTDTATTADDATSGDATGGDDGATAADDAGEGGAGSGALVPAAAGAATVPALAALSADAADAAAKPKLRPGEEFLDDEGTTTKRWWIPVAAVAGVLLVIVGIVLATRGGEKEEVNAGPAPSAFDPSGPRETTTTRSPGVAPTTASTAPSTTSSTETTTTTAPESTTTTTAAAGGGLGGGGSAGGGSTGGGSTGGGSTGGSSTGGGGFPVITTTTTPPFKWATNPTIEITGSTSGNAFLATATNQAVAKWAFASVPPSTFSYEVKDDMGRVFALGNGPNASGQKVLCEGQPIGSCYPPGPHSVRYVITTNTGLTIPGGVNFTVV